MPLTRNNELNCGKSFGHAWPPRAYFVRRCWSRKEYLTEFSAVGRLHVPKIGLNKPIVKCFQSCCGLMMVSRHVDVNSEHVLLFQSPLSSPCRRELSEKSDGALVKSRHQAAICPIADRFSTYVGFHTGCTSRILGGRSWATERTSNKIALHLCENFMHRSFKWRLPTVSEPTVQWCDDCQHNRLHHRGIAPLRLVGGAIARKELD